MGQLVFPQILLDLPLKPFAYKVVSQQKGEIQPLEWPSSGLFLVSLKLIASPWMFP